MRGLLLIAWQTITRHRLRSILTAASLVLGVMALTSVSAASTVTQQAIIRTALLVGGPTVTSSIDITTPVDPLEAAQRWARIVNERYGAGTATARMLSSNALTMTADGTPLADTQVVIVDDQLDKIRPFEIVDGVWLDRAPKRISPNVVFNRAAAKEVQTSAKISLRWGNVGEHVTASEVGIVDDGENRPIAYMDLGQEGEWRKAASRDGKVTVIAHTGSGDDSDLRTSLMQIESIAKLGGQVGDVQRIDTVAQLDGELNATARVFAVVSVVALAIAALGMLNIGLATLAERSDELSLRRAFGARRRSIVALMLLEAELLAIAAGLIGVISSYFAMPLTLTLFGAANSSVDFPLSAALIGVAAGALAALVGAVAPAIRAGNSPIANIMRG